MSIGAIITTPQGLAVVVQVLPTTIKLGSQVLNQVVAEPLTGGPPPPLPAGPTLPGAQPVTPYQSIEAQAAAVYVASVATSPPAVPASTTGSAGGTSGSAATPTGVHAAAVQAYQSTQDRAGKSGPQIILMG